MIKINNLKFAYNKIDVIDIEKLMINDIGIYSIIGHNGAGKTTLLKIIAGILKYKIGNVKINNKELLSISALELSSYRSYIPQNLYINFSFSVKQFISFGLYRDMNILSHIPYKKHKTLDTILHIFEIEHIKDKKITEISGGELQKVHIARAFFQDTEIMLFDEPVSNIDINYKYKIFKLLKNISNEKLIVYITHDINTALNYSDKIVCMKNGEIVGFYTPEETIQNFSKIYEGKYIIEKIRNKYMLIDEEEE